MVTASPPVSPKVVAAILMTQNPRVTAGSLLSTSSLAFAGRGSAAVAEAARCGGPSGRVLGMALMFARSARQGRDLGSWRIVTASASRVAGAHQLIAALMRVVDS